MKTCGFENQINAWLDGELSGAKLRSFEAHLQQCPSCQMTAGQFRGLLDSLAGQEEKEIPPALQDRLHAALIDEISKGDGRVKRKLNPWAITAIAAALVVFVAAGAVAAGGGFAPGIMAAPSAAPNALYRAAKDGKLSDVTGFTAGSAPEPMPAATAAPAQAPQMDLVVPNVESPAKGAGDYSGAQAQDRLTKPADGRKIIYTAYLIVETRKYDSCVGTVEGLLAKYGGYKENSRENGVPDASDPSMGRTAVISIRMPIDKYDAAMGELKAMGNVLSDNESTEDVSRQYVDTQARNKTLTLQRDKLYELLAKADTMDNIIALQNEISRLTVEIEQMTAQLNFWDDKVSYSTITVELRELVSPKIVKPVDPDLNQRMNGALNITLNNMKKGLENFTVGFVGFLPWLAIIVVIAGILAAILIPVTRKARRAAKKSEPETKQKEGS